MVSNPNTIDNSTIRFSNSVISSDITYDFFRAPFRNENNTTLDDYTQITSKYNQPRGVGTTPHIGVYIDRFTYNSNTRKLYPVKLGSSISCPVTWQLKYSIGSDKYVYYMHVEPLRTSGNITDLNDPIAKVGTPSTNGGYSDEHLHLGVQTSYSSSTGSVWEPLYSHYAHVSEYRYGQDLEFISYVHYDTDDENIVECIAYICDGYNKTWGFKTCEKVELWYKVGANSWESVNMSICGWIYDGSTYKAATYMYDLSQIADTGDVVQWYIAGYRSNISETHNLGLYPAKYAHPDVDGNNYTPERFSTIIE